MQNVRVAAPLALLAIAGLACTASATNTTETEGNDSKAVANAVTGMVTGDTITGNSLSSSATGLDYFRVRTAPAALGIYRHQLAITTAGTAGHSGTIRGLNQSAGIPGTTDSAVQTSSTGTTPARMNQWYGFGKQEEVYYRVTGTASTTSDYVATLDTTTVTPTVISGTVIEGAVTVKITPGAVDTAWDSDFWVYDANLDPISDFGHDDGDGTGATRNLTPGTYYVAMGVYNTCNNLGSPADDTFRTGLVLDFPNAVANSSTTTSATQLSCDIVSIGGTVTAPPVTRDPFGVVWYQFTVMANTVLTGVGNANPSTVTNCGTDTTLLTVSVTPNQSPPSTGIAVTADLSAVGGSPTQTLFDNGSNGDATPNDLVFSYLATVEAGSAAGAQSMAFTVTDAQSNTANGNIGLTIGNCPPPNETCGGAIAVGEGTTNYFTAGTNNDEAACAGGGPEVYFSFTPSSSGNYQIDNCGSDFDTVLRITEGCGGPQVACNDDSTCGLDSLVTVSLVSGTTYIIQADSYNTAGGAGGVLNITIPTVNLAVAGNSTGAELSNVLLTANVTPASPPISSGITVTADLSSIGGSGTQAMYDDGTTGGDVTAGDNIFSYTHTLPISVASGAYPLPLNAADAEARTATGTLNLTVTNGSSGACCTAGVCEISRETLCASGGGTWSGSPTCGGPAYTMTTGAGVYEDISTTGTLLATISACDDCTETVAFPAGFSFNHLGNVYTGAVVSSNGNIQFTGNSAALGNGALPSAAVPNDALYPLWDDLNPGVAGDVYMLDDTANGRLVFAWHNVTQFAQTTSESAQVILYSSGNAEFRYGAITPENGAGDYTIGWENAAGTEGGMVSGASIGSGNTSIDLGQTVLPGPCGPSCDGVDFNQDGLFPDTLDIDDFISVFGGGPCSNDPNCSSDVDFNNDGLFPDTLDIDALISVFSGGPCIV